MASFLPHLTHCDCDLCRMRVRSVTLTAGSKIPDYGRSSPRVFQSEPFQSQREKQFGICLGAISHILREAKMLNGVSFDESRTFVALEAIEACLKGVWSIDEARHG